MLKQDIIERIEKLGGNIQSIERISLQEDLRTITFNTVLYPKPKDTPWAKANEQEPIYGISQFIEENLNLLHANKSEFYTLLNNKYYTITEESFGQVFFKNQLFTPFKKGTSDYEEWNTELKQDKIRKVVKGTALEFILIGYSYGFPDNYFICLTDPTPENPMVYGTIL